LSCGKSISLLTSAAGIKKRARLAGVMIIQFIEQLPEGKSTPDFLHKPISLTIQEGKSAIFKARVCGDPIPEVSWGRTKGDMSDTEKCQTKYDGATGEYSLEIPRVSEEDIDTYKCYATNKYGRAVCTAALNVIGGSVDPAEFRKLLRKRKTVYKQEAVKETGEIDGRFWKIIMNAERKDYERICSEFGVKDFRVILKKLNEKKNKIFHMTNVKPLIIYRCHHVYLHVIWQDSVMIPNTEEDNLKHSATTVGNEIIFKEDAGLYSESVEKANPYSTDFKVPSMDFLVKFHEVKAKEREDALFECLLSHPFPRMKWMGKNATLQDGEKYTITVSENKLIHRLLIKDCSQLDKGIYSAAAGLKICSAWLIVEADSDPALRGRKKAHKFEVNIPSYKTCDMWTAPAFLVPLRQRTAPKGYECYMSCAIKGNPKPRVTWYRNNVSLNTDTNYLITNTCGVCSLLILRVSPKDWGEYTIEIESDLGRAVCSSQLTVRGESSADLLSQIHVCLVTFFCVTLNISTYNKVASV
uniref:Ig-like domain-containing protein n=1 Tax=Esox lucius TaxID=8010 RepID=A0A3P8YU90_ESOLU